MGLIPHISLKRTLHSYLVLNGHPQRASFSHWAAIRNGLVARIYHANGGVERRGHGRRIDPLPSPAPLERLLSFAFPETYPLPIFRQNTVKPSLRKRGIKTRVVKASFRCPHQRMLCGIGKEAFITFFPRFINL